MMAEERLPVPAVPSVVLALGSSLQERLDWLERRFRAEIGASYPGNLLRFRLLTGKEQVSPAALHALCDSLLVHPLWLSLQERGLAPGRERGPQLAVYGILSEDDPEGAQLLEPLHAALGALYEGQPAPSLCLFFVGTSLQSVPELPAARRPVPCFVLGPVKRFGYRTSGRQEPFETIRLSLNALLASSAAGEIEALLGPADTVGVGVFALGASAIAVARPQMEAWVRSALLQRLSRAWLAPAEPSGRHPAPHPPAREAVAEIFCLGKAEDWSGQPDGLWEKGLGRRLDGLFAAWANEILPGWGVELVETPGGHWHPVTHAQGDLYRHLQQTLSGASELQEDAQAALTQDTVQLVTSLRRHFAGREQAILARWSQLPERLLAGGAGSLAGMQEIVAAAEVGLKRAQDGLVVQRMSPLWLRSDRDITTLAGILAAQMRPVRSATERSRLAFVPPSQVALRLLPFVLLVGAVGADLRPGGLGLGAGLSLGTLLSMLVAGLEFGRVRRETYVGVCELCRLYENAIGGLVLGEVRNVVHHLQAAVAVTAAQLRLVDRELRSLDHEVSQALDELERFPRDNTYLERQLSDPGHCARMAEKIELGRLLGTEAPGEEPPGERLNPREVLAATLRGDLPAQALGPSLVEAVGATIDRYCGGMIETRVEEMLVSGSGQPFSPERTMDSLHQRALPLWPAEDDDGAEVALIVMSREASMAFQGWLQSHRETARLLRTQQRDRISYLRCRRLAREAGP